VRSHSGPRPGGIPPHQEPSALRALLALPSVGEPRWSSSLGPRAAVRIIASRFAGWNWLASGSGQKPDSLCGAMRGNQVSSRLIPAPAKRPGVGTSGGLKYLNRSELLALAPQHAWPRGARRVVRLGAGSGRRVKRAGASHLGLDRRACLFVLLSAAVSSWAGVWRHICASTAPPSIYVGLCPWRDLRAAGGPACF